MHSTITTQRETTTLRGRSRALTIAGKIFVLCCLCILTSCASNPFFLRKRDLTERFHESSTNVLSSGELSAQTVQELRILFLDEEFQKDPEKALQLMEAQPVGGRQTEQALALAEAAFYHANQLYNSDQKVLSAKYYLMSAAHAYDFLFLKPGEDGDLSHSFVSPYGRYMTELYNAAISRIVDIRETEKTNWTLPWQATVGNTSYRISRSSNYAQELARDNFDELISTYEIDLKGLRNLYRTQGIGAPFVGKRRNVPGTPLYSPFLAPVFSAPMTVLFKFSKKQTVDGNSYRDIEVSLINPFKQDTTTIEGKVYPLEADFSSSFGVMLRDINPGRNALAALLNPGNFVDQIKLVFLQPYDPSKIPVVLVHGLYSAPATYIQMVNDLMGVDEIRAKYQFWAFSYPTGLPIMVSSAALRKSLKEAQQQFDPKGTSPTFNKMVIVGHSMGGILSRTMLVEDGHNLWEAFSTAPIEKFDLTDDQRKMVQELFDFKTLPFISRAVFIAAPLRGSEVAKYSIVQRMTRWFISAPLALVDYRRSVLSKNKKLLNPEINNDEFIMVPRTSVDNLRSDSPVLAAYMKTPTPQSVPIHSIIAIQDAKQGPGSEDGVVKYESSHLDEAVSEKLVPAPHTCLEHPMTIAEVRRILLLHLEELAAQGKAK